MEDVNSNMLVAKLEGLLLLCYQGVSRSVRDDIAAGDTLPRHYRALSHAGVTTCRGVTA